MGDWLQLWCTTYGNSVIFPDAPWTSYHAEAVVVSQASILDAVRIQDSAPPTYTHTKRKNPVRAIESQRPKGHVVNHLMYAMCGRLKEEACSHVLLREVADVLLRPQLVSWNSAVPPLLAHALCTQEGSGCHDVSRWREHMQCEHRIWIVHRSSGCYPRRERSINARFPVGWITIVPAVCTSRTIPMIWMQTAAHIRGRQPGLVGCNQGFC